MSGEYPQNIVRQCPYCSQSCTWIFSGKKLKDGSKVYVDDTGSRWAGKRCPTCEKKRVQAAVKYDQFEKNNILETLQNAGFVVESPTNPIKISKDGVSSTVSIRRAYTKKDGKIVVEPAPKNEAPSNLTALMFQTVKLCSSEQIKRLEENFEIYEKHDERTKQTKRKQSSECLHDL